VGCHRGWHVHEGKVSEEKKKAAKGGLKTDQGAKYELQPKKRRKAEKNASTVSTSQRKTLKGEGERGGKKKKGGRDHPEDEKRQGLGKTSNNAQRVDNGGSQKEGTTTITEGVKKKEKDNKTSVKRQPFSYFR